MKNNNIVNPTGLKGGQINERMKELMGITPINENKSTHSSVELTKVGPDGNVYAIIRENHEHYIKITTKKSNILFEDFQYIGGLKNKKSEAYPTYAKAIKHLNLKFNSIAESMGIEGNINVFKNDNILGESGVAGFSNMQGSGFANIGNMDGHTPMDIMDKHEYGNYDLSSNQGNGFTNTGNLEGHTPIMEYLEDPYTNDVGRDNDDDDDEEADDRIKRDKERKAGIDEDETIDIDDVNADEDDGLTEEEKAVQAMMESDGYGPTRLEDTDDEEEEEGEVEKPIKEHRLSIARSLNILDDVIDSLNENTKKKVYTLK